MDTLKNFVIDAMIVELNEMEDREIYGADLGYEIFDEANCNGSYTCDAQEAKEFIKDYYEDIGDVVESIEFNLGKGSVCNCFNEPEKFQVQIMLEMSNALCAQCPFIDENWNNSIELTEENIKLIINQLMEQKD